MIGEDFEIDGEPMTFTCGQYGNKRLAIMVNSLLDGEVYGILTVNLAHALGPDEFFVKTWSENEALAEAAMKTGIFIDTGKRVRAGRAEAQVWKLK